MEYDIATQAKLDYVVHSMPALNQQIKPFEQCQELIGRVRERRRDGRKRGLFSITAAALEHAADAFVETRGGCATVILTAAVEQTRSRGESTASRGRREEEEESSHSAVASSVASYAAEGPVLVRPVTIAIVAGVVRATVAGERGSTNQRRKREIRRNRGGRRRLLSPSPHLFTATAVDGSHRHRQATTSPDLIAGRPNGEARQFCFCFWVLKPEKMPLPLLFVGLKIVAAVLALFCLCF
ncbi:uncharacterized protein LOC110271502 [Arachis ipaensis]|uniref:uncharacterized protein LOC110271502 n=1 Tax=Arachis ipaensis TaxID=130454 RepID=UPI000A2B6897|nr:uncharacterized protein LOC110271502 [Arachis ipaensis]